METISLVQVGQGAHNKIKTHCPKGHPLSGASISTKSRQVIIVECHHRGEGTRRRRAQARCALRRTPNTGHDRRLDPFVDSFARSVATVRAGHEISK
jgi:hypothetical protein